MTYLCFGDKEEFQEKSDICTKCPERKDCIIMIEKLRGQKSINETFI